MGAGDFTGPRKLSVYIYNSEYIFIYNIIGSVDIYLSRYIYILRLAATWLQEVKTLESWFLMIYISQKLQHAQA